MLSSIKNASMANKKSLEVVYTKECEEVAKSFKKNGFLENVRSFKEEGSGFKKLHLDLAFEGGAPKVTDVKIYSKPGRRIYKGYRDLGKVLGGYGATVVSTSRGVMDGMEARKKKLGGELICQIQ
jgi:small subunit ribosomal protein S8